MNRSKEREIFLKYLSDIYLQNPNLPISYDTIYIELLKFNMHDGKVTPVNFDSLINVQAILNSKYKNNNSVNTFLSSDGNYWAIENRRGRSDIEFFNDIYNGIKLYIPASSGNIYKISQLLFNFMIDEGIVMQCKIFKEMRNDTLICRVRTKEDALRVSNYIKSLGYTSNVRGNPFLYDDGNVCMTIDGCLSYNVMLARLLKEYLYVCRINKSLGSTSISSFNKFVDSQLEYLNRDKKSSMDLYQLSNVEQCDDFIRIIKVLSLNLDGRLNSDELFRYQDISYVRVGRSNSGYNLVDEAKILYVINTLATYYSVEYVHKIIMTFINTGEYNLFTRKYGDFGGVRAIVVNNFSSCDVKRIISDIGWKAFITATKVTYDKYGEEQMITAVKNVFNGDGILGFTNDFEVRSRLGLVIPRELLKEVMVSRLGDNDMSIDSISFANLVMEEIE